MVVLLCCNKQFYIFVTRSQSLICSCDSPVPASYFIREMISFGATAALPEPGAAFIIILQPFAHVVHRCSHWLDSIFPGAGSASASDLAGTNSSLVSGFAFL